MGLYATFLLAVTGFSFFLRYECSEMDGYAFPVNKTKFCPRNESEWNKRSAVFNCTRGTYACFPNNEIKDLIEFCYPFLDTIFIPRGLCLYLSKERSELVPYHCKTFDYGCPGVSHLGSTTYRYPSCVSIRNGCFLADSSCAKTSQLQPTGHSENQDDERTIWITTLCLVLFIGCLVTIVLFLRRRTSNRRNNTESGEEERINLIPFLRRHRDKLENSCEKDILTQWQQEEKFFIPTKAMKKVESKIESQNFVIVAGHSGSGKSAIAHSIALKYRKKRWAIKPVDTFEEIKEAYTSGSFIEGKTLFIMDDPIGKESFDIESYNKWLRYKQSFVLFLEKVKFIMTCRRCVLFDRKASSLHEDRSNIVVIDGSDSKLSNNEKREMFLNHARTLELQEEILSEILKVDTYFPLLCKLYANNKNFRVDIVKFFKEPVEVIKKEIQCYKDHDKNKYCALVCLILFNNKLHSDIGKTERFKSSLELCELSMYTSTSTIVDNLDLLLGYFVKNIGSFYTFYHDFVMEVTTFVFGTHNPKETIKYADIGFLRRRVRLGTSMESNDSFTIVLSDSHINELAERFMKDLLEDHFLEVVLNPCLKNDKLIDKIIGILKDDPQKLDVMLKKKEVKIEQDSVDVQCDQWMSKFDLLSLLDEISTLLTLIVFGHNRISSFCLKTLVQKQEQINDTNLFSAICCNGSEELFTIITRDDKKTYLNEKWNYLYPIHIASAYHNFGLLEKLIKLGQDVNMVTKNEDRWTPLALVLNNDVENMEKDDGKGSKQLEETIKILLENGAKVNLCVQNDVSPLYLACQKGLVCTVQRLIKQGAEVNKTKNDGSSPLSIAYEKGHFRIVEILQDSGADADSYSNKEHTDLFLACQKGDDSTLKSLLKTSVNVNLRMDDGSCPLFIACHNGHFSTVKLLLDHGASVNLCLKDGTSPLYHACIEKHDTIFQLLLDSGADVNACVNVGLSPLHVACLDENDNFAQKLLERGADVNLCSNDKTSPLLIACEQNNKSIVELLLVKGADVNLSDLNGVSPLFIISENGIDEILRILLKNGSNVNLCKNNGTSPLFIACQNGHNSTAQLLLDNGAKINLCMETGISPLYIACDKGHDSTVQLLLNNGADVNLCDGDGLSPLFVACFSGHDITVQLLINNGADVNLCNGDGSSPLCIACFNGRDSTVQLLLNGGADVNLCVRDGISPLYQTCIYGRASTVQLLINNGADVNLCRRDGSSPLYMACDKGHDNAVQLLLNNGADVNLCRKDGRSPLYGACCHGHDSTVQLLLNRGADVNLCRRDGSSPLDIACRRGHDSTVQLLQNSSAK